MISSYAKNSCYLKSLGFTAWFMLYWLPLTILAAPSTPLPPKLISPRPTYALDQNLYEQYPWAVTYYYGVTVNEPLVRIFRGTYNRWPENIQSFEVAHTLSEDNFMRRLVRPIVHMVQLAGNITIRYGRNEPTIYEFDPYFQFRWANLPWNHYLTTSFAVGEGISYVTSVPAIEKRASDQTKRLLNYLMLEATFALPSYPRWQVVARIHHRSGAYGLYRAGNSGSNDVGLAVRFLFD